MRIFKLLLVILGLIGVGWFIAIGGFSVKVKPSEVAIVVDLYGSDKGVDVDTFPTGRNFYNSITHDVLTYPAYVQNQSYQDISFKDVDGLNLSANFTIDYQFDAEKIPEVYTTYRKDANEIKEMYFEKWLRDAVVTTAASSGYSAENLISADLENFKGKVLISLRDRFSSEGVIIRDMYLSDLKIPSKITAKINAKIEATQDAQKKENELRSTQADVEKQVAVEEGKARSRIIESTSRAEANKILNESLTSEVLEFKRLELQGQTIEKWNGQMPKVQSGDSGIILDIGGDL